MFWVLVMQCNQLELHHIAAYLTDEQLERLEYFM